jgi:hypothetical protein
MLTLDEVRGGLDAQLDPGVYTFDAAFGFSEEQGRPAVARSQRLAVEIVETDYGAVWQLRE